MVTDSLKLAISQRLVKKLCLRCAIEEALPPEARLVRLGIKPKWLAGVNLVGRGRFQFNELRLYAKRQSNAVECSM